MATTLLPLAATTQGLFHGAGYQVHVPENAHTRLVEVPSTSHHRQPPAHHLPQRRQRPRANQRLPVSPIDIAGILLAGAISKAVLPPITPGTGPAITVNITATGVRPRSGSRLTASVGPFRCHVRQHCGYHGLSTPPPIRPRASSTAAPGPYRASPSVPTFYGFRTSRTPATSGFNNYGSLQSGLANPGRYRLGRIQHRHRGTSQRLGMFSIGSNLAGFFHDQATGMSMLASAWGNISQRRLLQRRRQQRRRRTSGSQPRQQQRRRFNVFGGNQGSQHRPGGPG